MDGIPFVLVSIAVCCGFDGFKDFVKKKLDIFFNFVIFFLVSFKILCKGRENRGIPLSDDLLMAKYGKKGKEGGKKGANRTGKSNPDHRDNGTDVTSDSHRRSTQKNGGKKTGVNPSSKSR